MNVLVEMTTLAVNRPCATSSKEEVAAWYEAKSVLHSHLAAEDPGVSAYQQALAAAAHERSVMLLGLPGAGSERDCSATSSGLESSSADSAGVPCQSGRS